MSYIRFMNEPNPIWDFISEMASQEPESPDRRHRGPPRGSWGWSPFDQGEPEQNPWAREMPHRPHHPHGPHGPRGPRRFRSRSPPRRRDSPPTHVGPHEQPPHPPAYAEDARSTTLHADDDALIGMVDNEARENQPAPDPEISTPEADANETSGDERRRGCFRGHNGRHGHDHPEGPHGFRHRFGRRGGWGGRGGMRGRGPWGAPWAYGSPHHHPYAHPHHRRRSSSPHTGSTNPFAHFANMFGVDPAGFDPERLREAFADALQNAATRVHSNGRNDTNEESTQEQNTNKDVDFRPVADIYDAPQEYVVHFALPGAKKEDISLNWDAEKSELNVAGVITREGDEEVMKTLALDERDVGVFERKVKLGRESVDAEGINARMENGLLVVRVPKKVDDEWTEVRKVDIE